VPVTIRGNLSQPDVARALEQISFHFQSNFSPSAVAEKISEKISPSSPLSLANHELLGREEFGSPKLSFSDYRPMFSDSSQLAHIHDVTRRH
jgi:hypothetical protein